MVLLQTSVKITRAAWRACVLYVSAVYSTVRQDAASMAVARQPTNDFIQLDSSGRHRHLPHKKISYGIWIPEVLFANL